MNYRDPAKQFCSEVASSNYLTVGVTLWTAISRISSSGLRSWLAAFGVRHFETQEPSDLEYDPQLSVVAEWRDLETLFQDHADNAVVDTLLEEADAGVRLGYPRWKLPFARLVKAYSALRTSFEGAAIRGLHRAAPVDSGRRPFTGRGIREAQRVSPAVLGARPARARRPVWLLTVRLRRVIGAIAPSPRRSVTAGRAIPSCRRA
jgi:hypothetical protein